MPDQANDPSNGYDARADAFMARREAARIGEAAVRRWARTLPAGAAVLDLGCGHGVPLAETLLAEGCTVYGVDASPRMVAAFRARFPEATVVCAPVAESTFFDRSFDAVVAWGLLFLLDPPAQRALIRRVAEALRPGGTFLFTAPAQAATWQDLLTDRPSESLGAAAYRAALEAAGLRLTEEFEDEGNNHYYLAERPPVTRSAGGERPYAGLDEAAREARAAIEEENHERLRLLLADHPALVSWRDAEGQTLLDATTSYAMDCSDPERERMYTRPGAADMLLEAGARLEAHTLEHVLRTGSRGMLALFSAKGALPRGLPVLAALGDAAAVDAWLGGPVDADEPAADRGGAARATVGQAFLTACRFGHADVAMRLLDRSIALDPALGRRIDAWRGREAFVAFLASRPDLLWQEIDARPWETFGVLQLADARDRQDLDAFRRWLDDEPWVLGPLHVRVQADLMLPACYQKGGEPFIAALLERDPAILHADPPPTPRSSLLAQALSYGNAHLVPLLTRIWPLPDDLPHAAGVGDATAVARWFDDAGRPVLGSLADHYPASDPGFPRADLRWGPPTAQQVLDVALAWAVLNGHVAVAETLLRGGADIDTDWATHEPASILHEAAIQGNEPAVRFLVDHGADLTKTDHRFEATAEGWARYGSGDEAMAELLAEAAERRKR